MACEKPPVACNVMQMNLCQLCGNGMQSEQRESVNYQKQVDPTAPKYSQIIPDYRYDEMEKDVQRKKRKSDKSEKPAPYQVCIPLSVVMGKSQTGANSDKNNKSETTEKKDQCPNTEEKEKEAEKKKDEEKCGSSPVSKASCFPGGADCGKPVKMMLCLPCPPPEGVTNSAASSPKRANKPVDYTYRCESRELRGGNLYSCCQCLKRNGLQHDCPRTPCQGRPACLTKPWPDCWPSGGCHGIDYTREKGTKRYDPCCEARFDKKDCGSCAGGRGGKAETSGNMMVVVCPPPPCGQ